ncbi:MAG: DNA gyrase inhibitor YacG [Rhizobacter sp.]
MNSEPPSPHLPQRRIVACPACRGDSVYAGSNPFRPFCSERCKNADFGAWATESYRLQARPSPSNDADSEGGDC